MITQNNNLCAVCVHKIKTGYEKFDFLILEPQNFIINACSLQLSIALKRMSCSRMTTIKATAFISYVCYDLLSHLSLNLILKGNQQSL